MLRPCEKRLALRKLKNTSRFEGGKSLHSNTVAKSSLAFPSSSLSPAFKKLKLKSLHCVEGKNMLIWGTFPLRVFFSACHSWDMNDDKEEKAAFWGLGAPYCAGRKGMNRVTTPVTLEAPQVCGLPGAEWVLMGLLCPPPKYLLLSSLLDSHVL